MPDNVATQGLTCKESLHQRKKVAWRLGDAAFGNLQTLNYRTVWFGSKKSFEPQPFGVLPLRHNTSSARRGCKHANPN